MSICNYIKVSIIVPFYNASATIKRSLSSALNQTINKLEVLTIDDGSTDDSLDIVKEMMRADNRIKIFSSPHLGCGGARNKALPYAAGEYIYFLDADDYMFPDLLEKMIYELETKQAQIAFCRFKNVNSNNEYLNTPYEEKLVKLVDDVRDIRYLLTPKLSNNENSTQSVLWSLFRVVFLSKIVKQNKIVFSVIPFAEDFLFLTDYLKFCQKACLVDEYLYLYTKNTDGSSNHSRGFTPDYNKVMLMVLNRAGQMLDYNTLYAEYEKERIYKIFALLIAYNMILNVFCSRDYEREYEKNKKLIVDIYSLQDVESCKESFSERHCTILRGMQTIRAKELYAQLKEFNIIK